MHLDKLANCKLCVSNDRAQQRLLDGPARVNDESGTVERPDHLPGFQGRQALPCDQAGTETGTLTLP